MHFANDRRPTKQQLYGPGIEFEDSYDIISTVNDGC